MAREIVENISVRAWTDYPFTQLGDEPHKDAPVRPITMIGYDHDKYVTIIVEGVTTEIKGGYCYKEEGPYGSVPPYRHSELVELFPERSRGGRLHD